MAARQVGAATIGQQNELLTSKQIGPSLQTAQPSHDCDGATDVGELVQPVDCAVILRSSMKKTVTDSCGQNIATLSPVVSCQQTQPPPQLQQQPSLGSPVPMEQLKTMAAEMNALLSKIAGAISSGQDEKQMLKQELERAQLSLESLKEMRKQMKEAGTSPSDKTSICAGVEMSLLQL